MASILLQRRTTLRPTVWAGVNRDTPLSRGLIRWLPCSHNLPLGYDVIAPAKSATVVGAVVRGVSALGGSTIGVNSSASNYVRLPTGADFASETDLTVAFWFPYLSSSTGAIWGVMNDVDSTVQGMVIQLAGTNSLRLAWSGSWLITFASNVLAVGRTSLIVYRYTAATDELKAWVDTTTGTGTGAFTGQNTYAWLSEGGGVPNGFAAFGPTCYAGIARC